MDLGRLILSGVGDNILQSSRQAIIDSHIHSTLGETHPELATIVQGLTSDTKKDRESAISLVQGKAGRQLIKVLQEQHREDLQPIIDALIQARICYRLNSSDETVRKEAVRHMDSRHGQQVKEQILTQTRENMSHILYDAHGKRISHSHQELARRMPEVLSNIYAVSLAVLGFVPHEEQFYGVIATVSGPGKKGTLINMKTGEGKTFVAAASAIVQALHNSGVHVVTSNDYLAEEGAVVAAKVASGVGLRVGLILSTPPEEMKVSPDDKEVQKQRVSSTTSPLLQDVGERSEAYAADITYGYKLEYEFDNNKDKLAKKSDQLRQVRRDPSTGKIDRTWGVHKAYAIFDEVDSVQLDQARTPSSIETPSAEAQMYEIRGELYTETELYLIAALVAKELGRQRAYEIQEGVAIPLMRDDIGDDTINKLLRRIKITETRPGQEPREKLPLLGEDETYHGGKIVQDAKGREALQLLDTVEEAENATILAGILQPFLHAALQAEFIEQEDGSYRVIRDPSAMRAEIRLLNSDTRRDEALSRYQGKLHGSLEAKQLLIEQANNSGYTVTIKPETRVLASTTTSSYWNRYERLSGMTGTTNDRQPKDAPVKLSKPPTEEFADMGFRIINIPPHKPSKRIDFYQEFGFRTREEKLHAINRFLGTFYGVADPTELVEALQNVDRSKQQARPVLIGMHSKDQIDMLREIIEQSDWFIEYNKKHPEHPITIHVLSAEDTQDEGRIIALAGQPATITIASVAGRGTDIKLSDLARRLGGLYPILGEHGENGRIDDQFRGRGGRQGDPSETRSYVSLDDQIFRKAYGPDWIQRNQDRLVGTTEEDGEEVEVSYSLKPDVTRQHVLRAQARITNREMEARYALRRDYKTIDGQLDSFYADRQEILLAENQQENVRTMVRSYIRSLLIGKLPESTTGFANIPPETDDAIPQKPMTREEAQEFSAQLQKIVPLSSSENDRLIHEAMLYGRRMFLDHATNIVMKQYTSSSSGSSAVVAQMIRNHPEITPEILEQAEVDFETFARLVMLGNFDEVIGQYLTSLLDLREDILHRQMFEQAKPGDSGEAFRIDAYQMYREFKPHLQEIILTQLFSPLTFQRYILVKLLPHLHLEIPVQEKVQAPAPTEFYIPPQERSDQIVVIGTFDSGAVEAISDLKEKTVE